MHKQVFVLFFLFSVALAEYFAFTDSYLGRESSLFVVELTKAEDINHALDLLNGTTTDRPHIQGNVVKFSIDYNRNYNYHLDPNTIQFFNNGSESCDIDFQQANPYIHGACTKYLLPDCIQCSSTSKIVKL